MSKSATRLISIKQYRLTDLFVFALILALSELLGYFAIIWFPGYATFTFSLMLPISLIVLMRWGWLSVFYPVGAGLIYCLLNAEGFQASTYLTYCIGNACMALVLIYVKLVGREKIAKKFYLSAILVILAWLAINLGRSAISAMFGNNFFSSLLSFCSISDNGVLSLVMAIIIIAIMRKLDGMFEDQKAYLLRLEREKKERMRRDEFGDEPIEIDEQSLAILNKGDNDLY
jgi:hypothetical protein